MGGNASSSTRGYTTGSAYDSGYTFAAGDLVSIGITGDGSTSSRPTTEVVKQYTVAAGTGTQDLSYSNDANGTTTNEFDWLSKNEELCLRAWSYGNSTTPASDPCASGNTFTIETTQNTLDANNKVQVKELLYSPSTTYKYQDNSGAIEIPLYHQLARVVVTVVSDNATIPVEAMTIGHSTSDLIPITGSFSAPSSGNNYGSWYVVAKATQATHWGTIIPKEEATGVYSAVLIPGTPTEYPADLRFINITLGTGANAETFAYKLPTGGITLSPGKQYNYTISVKNSGISVQATISDWSTNTTGDNATAYIPSTLPSLTDQVPPKTTIATATTADLAVGDIVCEDGSIYASSAAANMVAANKTPVGIIAFVNDGTDIGNAATELGKGRYTTKSQGRALVLGLKDASVGLKWHTNTNSFGQVYSYDGTYKDPDYSQFAIHYEGFERTRAMNNDEFPAAQSAYNYTGLIAPAYSTGWFMPSAGQWKKIVTGLTGFSGLNQDQWSNHINATYSRVYLTTRINNALSVTGTKDVEYTEFPSFETAESLVFWSITEKQAEGISILNCGSSTLGFRFGGGSMTTETYYTRPVFAF